MGFVTTISWCHHTFNPWWGCTEVSPACDHCYARLEAKRYGHPVWGSEAPRLVLGGATWRDPAKGTRRAQHDGIRRRVFCASMADVLEERDDVVGRELDRARQRLWDVIASTGQLDWLLLTKRPAGYRRLLPREILARPNVWPGVTVETHEYFWRWAEVAELVCAGPRWVSYEPALGPLDLGQFSGLGWIIIGGESGPVSREFRVEWLRTALAQARALGIPVFYKQAGARLTASYYDDVYRQLFEEKGCNWPHPLDWDVRDGEPPPQSRV